MHMLRAASLDELGVRESGLVILPSHSPMLQESCRCSFSGMTSLYEPVTLYSSLYPRIVTIASFAPVIGIRAFGPRQ